jgi:hypothetical protein
MPREDFMTLAKTGFPDPGFMLGVLDKLLDIDALTESVIEKTLSGIANDNFGIDPDEHYARFKIEEARAYEAIRRLSELELNEERLLDIHRLYFDGGDRIYSILEDACDICTGGESEYYCCHDLEGVSKLPNLSILNLDGYGYQRKGLCLAPLKGHSNLETLVLTPKCTSIDVLTTLAKLSSVDFCSVRLTDDEMDQSLPVIEALRARNVEIKNEPIARTPKPPPSPPALVTPKPPPTAEAEPQAPEPDPRETRRSGSTWETTNGEKTSYTRIEADIVMGSHSGSGHTDSAGSCSREAFLNGQFHDTIRSDHGPAVLQEVLDFVGPKDLSHQDVKLGDGDDLRQRIRLFLAGPSALPPQAHLNYGHEFLVQAGESFNTLQRIVLSRAIAHHIEDRDAQVRSGVIRFFQYAAASDDFGALARALREDDGLFEDVVDPIQGAIGDTQRAGPSAGQQHPTKGPKSHTVPTRGDSTGQGFQHGALSLRHGPAVGADGGADHRDATAGRLQGLRGQTRRLEHRSVCVHPPNQGADSGQGRRVHLAGADGGAAGRMPTPSARP